MLYVYLYNETATETTVVPVLQPYSSILPGESTHGKEVARSLLLLVGPLPHDTKKRSMGFRWFSLYGY